MAARVEEPRDESPTTSRGRRRLQDVGLVAGPLLALAVGLALPESPARPEEGIAAFTAEGRATAAVAVWMAVWWLTEAIPVAATALVPLVALPLLGAVPIREAAAPYAHPLIFLFMGGFMIAKAMERWGLHRRIALRALATVGDEPTRLVGGFMIVTAGLSMWVSNSATAIMMLPVAMSVVELVEGRLPEADRARLVRPLGLALLLGIAYGASIGGLATPIGTPPNLFLLSFASERLGREISFVRWMGVGLPIVAVFLPVAWWLLTRRVFPSSLPRIEGGGELVRRTLAELGPMKRGERVALAVFVGAAGLWITRPLLQAIELAGTRPLAGLSDAGVALLAALVLFVVPVDRRTGTFALDWEHAVRLPWGVLLLFGGGLSLAAAIEVNGVGDLLARQVPALRALPAPALVALVVAGVVFLTELTSNTATAATLVPILASLAPPLGLDPLELAVPAALAASCAFMLPVATPPNAIVFGSGRVSIPEMSRAGWWLNLAGIVLITGATYAVVLPVLLR